MDAIVESSEDAVITTTLDGIVMSWNKGAERIFGYSPKEAIGRNAFMLIPHDRQDEEPQILERLKNREEEIEALETVRQRKDGRRIYVSLSISAIRDETGTIVGISKTVRDITERKHAEEQFRLAVEASPSGMLMVDETGTILLVNAQIEAQFGYSREELLGKSIETLLPHAVGARHREHRAEFFVHPEPRQMGQGRELFGLRKDGKEIAVEIGLNPIQTLNGLRVLASVVDITERKRAEEQFKLAVEAAPNGMLMVDERGTILLVNAQIERQFGYAREELLGQPVEILLPDTLRAKHHEQRLNFFAHPEPRRMGEGRELFGLRKDGREIAVEIGLNPIQTADGLRVLASVVDITERKRAEEALRESGARYRAIVENSLDAVITMSEQGLLVGWNDPAERMFGWSSDEVIGRSLADLIIPLHLREAHKRGLTHYLATGEGPVLNKRIDITALHRDGYEFPVELSIVPILQEGHTLFSAFVRDISERKRAEERFRLSVEASPSGMLMVDERGTILLVNAQIERQFGYAREELLGQPVEVLLPESFRARHRDHRLGFFAHPEPRQMGRGRDLFGVRKDGKEIAVEIGLNPIQTPDGLRVLASVVDITERKQMEAQLRQTERLAELGTLASGMAHEIGTPMNVILGRAEYVMQRTKEEKTRKGLETIVAQVERITKIMNQLLTFARRRPAERRPIHLKQVILDSLEILHERIGRHRIKVETALAEEVPLVQADPDQMTQVLLNLLINALHAMPDGGRLGVRLEASQGEVLISVYDTGHGISQEHLTKIFAPFFTTKDVGKGTGLGLTVVHGIIHEHGGTITVESEVGRGTTFTIHLPALAH